MAFLEKNMEKDIFYILRGVHITTDSYMSYFHMFHFHMFLHDARIVNLYSLKNGLRTGKT